MTLLLFWLWPGTEPASPVPVATLDEGHLTVTRPPAEPPAASPNPFAPRLSHHAQLASEVVSASAADAPRVDDLVSVDEPAALTTDAFQDYLRRRLPSDALAHPVWDQYLSGALGYVQAFPDWLVDQPGMTLSASELAEIERQLASLGVTEHNLAETQRLQTALEWAEAQTRQDGGDFQWQVEQYDRLLQALTVDAADPLRVQEVLASQVFSEEDRSRALQYHRGLYQASPEGSD